jgi:chaperonin cofactor prefoldin
MPANSKPPHTTTRIGKSRARTHGTHVTRAEFNRVIDRLNERGEVINQQAAALERVRQDLDIQFKRIAELQAELDGVKKAWTKSTGK